MIVRAIVGISAMAVSILGASGDSFAEDGAAYSNQLFVRAAYSALTSSRANEVFTDTLSAQGFTNSDKGGFSIAAGLDLSAAHMDDLAGANLMGEVFIEFSKFSDRPVVQTTSALLGAPVVTNVPVTELNVTIAPKARFDELGSGRIRPFLVPIGLAFLVNSPPSDNSGYLDIGLHFGGGIDFLVVDRVSVGADIRYTHGFDQSNTSTRYWSTGVYTALNF